MAAYLISSEETNFARLTTALLQVCSDLLREVLVQHVPNRDVQAAVVTKEKLLKPLLNAEQKRVLFPNPPVTFSGSLTDFDISLLYLLIRNISSVLAHASGWGKPPHDLPRDSSIGANVERVRLLRNKISGHSANGKVSKALFERLWQEIEECVQELEKSLSLRHCVQSLASLKVQDMDPEYASRCISNFTAQLSDIQEHLSEMREDISKISAAHTQDRSKQDLRTNKLTEKERRRTLHFWRFVPCGPTETSGFNLKVAKTRLKSIFEKDYRFVPKNPFDRKSGVDITSVYIDVDIEDFQNGEDFSATHCGITEFENLFKENDSRRPTRIYLEGNAGAGKTVYACKLVTDWCNASSTKKKRKRKTYLSMFDICFALSLHNVENFTTLTDLIRNVVGDYSGIDIVGLEEFVIQNQDRVLIIMDGLDEYRDNCPMVDAIVNKQVLQTCTVVITSRPWKIQGIINDRLVDRRVKILGFNDNNRVIYARKCFQYILNIKEARAESMSRELIHELKKKHLVELSKLPLILLFICYLWEYNQQLPDTETEIYINVVKCLVGNHAAKRIGVTQTADKINLGNIDLELEEDLFLTLGYIAYTGLKFGDTRNELVFDLEEVKSQFDNEHIQRALQIGLLSEQRNFSVYKTTSHLSFPHKSIQEFFTAYLFAFSADESQANELREKTKNINSAENFENILKFVVGIKQNNEPSRKILNDLARRCLSISAQCDPTCKNYLKLFLKLMQELKSGTKVSLSLESVHVTDVTCLQSLSKVKFENVCTLQIENIKTSSEDVAFISNVGCSLLTLASVEMRPSEWRIVLGKLTELHTLRRAMFPSCRGLQFLSLKNVTMVPEGWKELFSSLMHNPELKDIYIGHCTGPSNSCIEIPSVPALKRVKFERCVMEPTDWKGLFVSFSNAQMLETIDIEYCSDMHDSKVHVPALPVLQRVGFEGIGMNKEDWESFFALFENKEKRAVVYIRSCSNISDCQVQVSDICVHGDRLVLYNTEWPSIVWRGLLSCVKDNSALLEMEIIKCSVKCGHACQFQLPLLSSLKALKLNQVSMMPLDWKILFSSLPRTPNLETFSIIHCLGMSGSQLQIPSLPELKALTIWKIQLKPSDWSVLFASLSNAPKLGTTDIWFCSDMRDSQIRLPIMPALTTLELGETTMEPHDWKALFTSLHNARQLESIHLNSSNMSASQVLIPALPHLHTLLFRHVNMLPGDWRELIQSLGQSPCIRTIEIMHCRGLKGSRAELPYLPELTEVKMGGSDVSDEDKHILDISTKFAPKLQTVAYKK